MLFFFPRGVLDEILNLIESVSERFPFCFKYGIFFCRSLFVGPSTTKSLTFAENKKMPAILINYRFFGRCLVVFPSSITEII